MKIPKYGDRSAEVALLQDALNKTNGDHLNVDGEFGPKTKAVLADFQVWIGLKGSGILGQKTMEALFPKEIEPIKKIIKKITRGIIAAKIIEIVSTDVNNKLRESGGKNRGPRIDEFNSRAKSYVGAPYCASGLWCAIDDACKILGLNNPVPPTSSSQAFRKPSFVPPRYMREDGEFAKVGDFGVLQTRAKKSHGHLTLVRYDQASHPNFYTMEYNTDGSGTRDGDGAYSMQRSTVDFAKINSNKRFICFTDIPQWIEDFNS